MSHVTRSERVGVLRRLYEWTIQWADRPHGERALFLIAFIESSIFPIPPDVLLIALCVGASRRSFRFAALCTAGSVLGGLAGYAIGYWGFEAIGEPIVRMYKGEAVMEKIRAWYDAYGFWGTLTAAVTPIPYKVFTIASGWFRLPLPEFILASVAGRALRFFAVAGLIWRFGPRIKATIERYFDWFAWGFLALLILGFVTLKLLH